MKPISVQLYSLRDASSDNFDAVLTQLADTGYCGVEPFNLFGKSPTEFRPVSYTHLTLPTILLV